MRFRKQREVTSAQIQAMPFWKCFPCLHYPTDENITELDYSNGTLTNVPPDVSQFERTLEKLYLSSNRIADLPPELFYCQGLRVLKINDNELETIPNAIGSLRQLQILDLSRNALTNVPDNIKSCKYITHLDLSLNNLQRLPDAITNLITLQELFLNETYLEFLPANFGRLVNLKILELRSNNLITLPKSMSRLTELTRIDIGANEFTELPEVIGQLTKLQELWIDYNRIRRVPPNISNLRELVHFEANSNQLTNFPNEISNWRNLEVLSLSTNDLETLPFSIGMLKRLVTIKCDSNQLKELPDSICHLEQLEELFIDHNFIVRLPSTIGLLRKMRFLIADENLLRRLPNEISSCTNLTVLSLRGNKLTELPHDIGHLKNLKVINAVDNLITNLPVSVLNLTNLSALWISDNQSQPLVPLQYADNATKSELTCFMLPQFREHPVVGNENSDQNVIMPSNIEWYQENEMNSTSPSKRICFADETNEKPGDTMTTRLLRSPTPYPKELRQMAKFATRNFTQNVSFQPTLLEENQYITAEARSKHEQQQLSSKPPSPSCVNNHHIKEAKVLHNSKLISDQEQTLNRYHPQRSHHQLQHSNANPPLPTQSRSPGGPSCDNLANVQCYPISASTPLNSSEVEQYYANHSVSVVDSTSIDPHQSQPYTHYSNYYEPLNIPASARNDYTDAKLYSIVNKETNMNTSNPPSVWSQTPPPSLHQESVSQPYYHHQNYRQPAPQEQHSNYNSYSQYQQRRQEPPPYHIAKAYTKKSRQDLLTYDSVRNRNNSIEFLNHINSHDDNSEYDLHLAQPASPTNLQECNNGEETDLSIPNNNNHVNGTFSIDNNNSNHSVINENGNGISGRGEDEVDHPYHHQSQELSSIQNRQRDFKNEQNNEVQLEVGYDSSTSPGKHEQAYLLKQKSSPWLFGLHRNPTVKQVTLKKDPTLGFEIKEVANRGIFVSVTTPNTPANELLRINDKILDVDGIDFSKINHCDAQKVLIDSGPILNIMISRT